jgi:hypothetical protein
VCDFSSPLPLTAFAWVVTCDYKLHQIQWKHIKIETMWISTLYSSYFQPFWWFCGQLLRIEEELGPKAIYAGENWRPKLSSWKHNQPYMCFYLLYTHTHTHIHIYCIYVHVYDCFYRHKVIVFLSFLFYTLFSLSLFFLHFGIYRMLNIIFATCLSIGQKKNYMTQQDLETF